MKTNTRSIAAAAVIGALYAVLTIALAPISYGAVQFRVSEALCVLPYFLPSSAWGLFIGCAAANLITGNIFDIIFGSLATLLAALCTAYFGRKTPGSLNRLAACLMPVIFNAVIVGIELGLLFFPGNAVTGSLICGLEVGAGELISVILGWFLIKALKRTEIFDKEE